MQYPFTIDAGGIRPLQAHAYDAGWDLFFPESITTQEKEDLIYDGCFYSSESIAIAPYSTVTIPLKVRINFELVSPSRQTVGLVLPRSSISKSGIVCHAGVIDAGYTGPIHVTLTNMQRLSVSINRKHAIAQVCFLPALTSPLGPARLDNAFGSSNL